MNLVFRYYVIPFLLSGYSLFSLIFAPLAHGLIRGSLTIYIGTRALRSLLNVVFLFVCEKNKIKLIHKQLLRGEVFDHTKFNKFWLV